MGATLYANETEKIAIHPLTCHNTNAVSVMAQKKPYIFLSCCHDLIMRRDQPRGRDAIKDPVWKVSRHSAAALRTTGL